ncbi:hypothetical protein TUSST3_15230 [Streptomyces sp. TUS-ST3]|nr:hypothetical protein TUSST3_15230 [Streptomyces sp. TUS-ST3]
MTLRGVLGAAEAGGAPATVTPSAAVTSEISSTRSFLMQRPLLRVVGEPGRRAAGLLEAGKRGSGEAGKRGSGEAGKRGSGEAVRVGLRMGEGLVPRVDGSSTRGTAPLRGRRERVGQRCRVSRPGRYGSWM